MENSYEEKKLLPPPIYKYRLIIKIKSFADNVTTIIPTLRGTS
jgi:hypothetical protein